MHPAPSRSSSVALALLAAACPACAAHIAFRHDDPPVYAEIEPNDSAFSAPFYGGLRNGDAFGIAGHVSDDGADIYDGFAVRVDEPLELVFDLESHAAFSDLDVCVYDPDLGEFVVCADGPFDPEHGSVVVLEAGKRLHLVVTSAAGDVDYTLHLAARAVVHGYAEQGAGPLRVADERKAERRRGYHADPRGASDHEQLGLGGERRGTERVNVVLYDLDTGAQVAAHALRLGDRLVDLRPPPRPR